MPRPRYARSSILGRITSINAERGSLGTDKSVPYKNLVCPSPTKTVQILQTW
ncbi:MAG: hypothetical protein FWG87_13465 [Defluviitaleaceae bacterium]|nr:hypothetical protein [Defluviitaleaceae bacterium]